MDNDNAYDYGDPKRSDYTGPVICVLCGGHGQHYADCWEVTC
jgi:hypothetical protein